MTIRTKLYFGFGGLFSVLVLTGAIGLFHILHLAENAGEIIKDNHRSIEYLTHIQKSLQKWDYLQSQTALHPGYDQPGAESAQIDSTLLSNFTLEEQNLTEPGEHELVRDFFAHYQAYTSLFKTLKLEGKVSPEIYISKLKPENAKLNDIASQIIQLNLSAILRKNDISQSSADRAIFMMISFLLVFLSVSLILVLKFPGYIARPVNKLVRGIESVAERQYEIRLDYPKTSDLYEAGTAFNRMAERLKAMETSNIAKVLAEKSRIEAVINRFSDALIGFDTDLNVIFVNAIACELTGIQESAIIGKNAVELIKSNEWMQVILQGFTGGSEKPENPFDHIMGMIKGKEQFFSREIIEVTTHGPEVIRSGYVIILRNITVYHELNVAKTNLIATISHEMKTPLASINLTLKLLKDSRVGQLTPDQTQLLDSLRQDSQRLSKIVGELLDLSQVESGHIKLVQTEIHPGDLILYAVSTLMVQIESKAIDLDVAIPDHLPSVMADLEKTLWVAINIISNAIRYTPAGGRIRVDADGSGNEVIFSVKDTGPGIDPSMKDKIFEKFVRLNPESANKKESTGLGLAIAKEFILAQGGKIWVDSKPGEGSTFYFSFPVYRK